MAKKKTKPAANPARGFATTSLPSSKPKISEANDESATQTTGGSTPARQSASAKSAKADQSKATSAQPGQTPSQRELHELSPEELEARLEASELQHFVEQHVGRVRKDATRQASRLHTDKRVLRGQADYLLVRDWLPDELVAQIAELVHSERHKEIASFHRQNSPKGDELVSKVWTLRNCLIELEVPSERVTEALAVIITHPPPQESNGLIWGLSEVLEWLALHSQDQDEDYEYDNRKQKSLAVVDDDIAEDVSSEKKATKKPEPLADQINADFEDVDFEVSDVASDLEPDELVSTYLRTKTRLYELDPSTDQGNSSNRRSRKGGSSTNVPETTGKKKLRQKLSRIESDVLFDKREADVLWMDKKNDLAKEAAGRRKYRLELEDGGTPRTPAGSNQKSTSVMDEAEKMGQDLLQEIEGEEEGMLSGMFEGLGATEASETTDIAVTIRDFGRMSGMNPKRVLEEACKARDSAVKLNFKMVSPTTYASRHAVTIAWSKDQEALDSSFLDCVELRIKPRTYVITSTNIATPDAAQSEALVATLALFIIVSGSPKEEKAHLKLPPAFRDLWDELSCAKRDHMESGDRDVVKQVRALVQEHSLGDDDEEDDQVVFNANSRKRFDGTSGTSTPRSLNEQLGAPHSTVSEELKQLWLRKTSTAAYQRMLQGRMTLPMFQFRDVALQIIAEHQVTILCGETGCGKSTQLPAFILEHELSQGRSCRIYCTEPRRISAISLAQRVSQELGEHKDDIASGRSLIGYAIRLESHVSAATKLIYATVGIVLRMLERADGIDDVTHLVIDEVHERSIDTDFLLIVLRSLMLRRPQLKVVLMSATVDAQKFSNYLDGAPIITVPGRTFPVQTKYLEDAIELTGHTNEDAAETVVDEKDKYEEQNTISGAGKLEGYSKSTRNTLASYDEYRIDFSLIMKLLQQVVLNPDLQQYSNAVLVFLPGIAEIRQLNDMLGGSPAFGQNCKIYPLHSSFSSEDQQAAFEIPPPGVRKIVLATNIAETGITIPDVTCVIDTGKHKEMRFDERRQLSKLILSFIARANAKQRRGRAGRVQEGLCFHLYTKHRHDEIMAEQQTPEMLRLSLQELVMKVKACKLGDIEHTLSQALDSPSSKNIRRAIDALVEVGALTANEDLTSLGTQIARLPLDSQLGKFVLLGSIFGCLDFALTAAAALTSKSPFLSPMHAKKQADTVRLGYKRGDSDLLTLYNAYCAWKKTCQTPGLSEFQFCKKNFLSSQNLRSIEDLKGQLLNSLIDAGFVRLTQDERHSLGRSSAHRQRRYGQEQFVEVPSTLSRADDNDTICSSVVAWSFYPKVVKQEGKGWRNIANNQALSLHPSSVSKTGLPSDAKLLSFYSIMQSASRFTNAQETTPVPEFALVLLAGDAVFHMFAGVIVIDGNRLRYKVRDWKTMMVLKVLRLKLQHILSFLFKCPGTKLTGKMERWMEILEMLFEHRQTKKAKNGLLQYPSKN